MGWVITFFLLYGALAGLTGYLIAMRGCTKHLKEANDLNELMLQKMKELIDDPADWWKKGVD